MAIKHNQQIPHNHFRKDWQRRVRVHFDQPGRKLRRRNARLSKAAAVAPRPVDKLRPIVRCPTLKYNRRVRAGRGFTITELKVGYSATGTGWEWSLTIAQEAGIPRKLAPTIGISVDPRRQNLSTESLAVNVERLKAYQARLILFPRKLGQHKKGDASKEDVSAAKNTISSFKLGLPIVNAAAGVSEIKKSELPTPVEGGAYRKLRDARSEHRNQGKRDKRAKEKADEAAAAKK
ncbi:60S ribosomal protein L13 [Cadophora gregata]|uniref:60S ribosomal protein L13 n=1 Tax=Cadophora gregata TaxID=51156 RepID=UPI0026DD9451|nr:60S ribosomal protein L13 [Cadophora gregata]KAK0117605.1 60S ribosomal protein L13 [Cadophora gregata]